MPPAVRDDRAFTSLVITGHSLGGAMLLSTMQRVVFNATIDRATVLAPASLSRLGDLVVLLNPAVEARRYKIFRAEAAQSEFTGIQRPIILTISSDGDWPNHKALRVARFFPTLFTPTRWREWRDSTTALGFSKADISHSIDAPKELLEVKIDELKEIPFWWDDLPTDDASQIILGRNLKAGHITWTNSKEINEHIPFIVARSRKTVVPGHSDIFTTGVVSFLAPYVRAAERKNILQFCGTPPYQRAAVK